MEDDSESTIHFNWLSQETESQPLSGRKTRRQSAIDASTISREIEKRRLSHGSLGAHQEPLSRQIRGSSTLSDVREIKSHSLRRLNEGVKERQSSVEEKRFAWSKGRTDSGILSSFDSSHFSSINNVSSIDALLDERKVDAEEVLTNLGFAPVEESLKLEHRIPMRFFRPTSRSKSDQIERFINSNADQFQDLLSRRRMLQLHHQSSEDFTSRPCECDSNDAASDPGSGHSSGSPGCFCVSCCREAPTRMISSESMVRLMSCGLPPRFVASLSQRSGRSGVM